MQVLDTDKTDPKKNMKILDTAKTGYKKHASFWSLKNR